MTDYIPSDPIILFSWVNTKLRDRYQSLDDLCEDYHIERSQIINKLKQAGFTYEPVLNQFR